ncbi:hypothetical protein PVL29_003179 [Vitis rotundifolia]|uniref:Cyclin-dependent kinase inhibitor n=1 Tax=Vitis rotundifolia TaxID=103349 RepID=A0AA39E4Q7_VITRO|nr:hypothetical protein PVL29_003179 [Vitis rotundifolia]
MEEYMSECETIVGIAVMEVGHGGVRARPVEASTTDASKRRRIASGELRTSPSSNVELRSNSCYVNSPPDSASPAQSENYVEQVLGDLCASSWADHAPESRCSSNEPGEVVRSSLRSADLEAKGFETENSTYSDGRFSRETTPVSELCADSAEMESPAKTTAAKPRRKSTAGKMPSTVEIEEFFSAAEKYQQQRFAEKYNYDIVKDAPMEGRYQWVRLER